MPIGIGTNATGKVWPTELETSRPEAPAIQYVIDPALPILGTDPNFESDKVVIGRGRLVGVKADADGHGGSNITTTYAHRQILTVSDGKTVMPMGYAAETIVKDWEQKLKGTMPKISRDYVISTPYVNAINGAYGAIKQGDKVTAYYGAKTNTTPDPRYKGAIAKWVPKALYAVLGSAANTDLGASYYSGFTPRVVARLNSSGAYQLITGNTVTWSTNTWKIAGTAANDTIFFEYGQGPEMIAGECWGMEGIDDLPGFLKWVETNFGAWAMPPMWKPSGNDAVSTATAYGITFDSAKGYATIDSLPGGQRIDVARGITVRVKAGQTVYVWNEVTSSYDALTQGASLPVDPYAGTDYTRGRNYMIDPLNARIVFFGVASDANGAALADADYGTMIEVVCWPQSLMPEPAYGLGMQEFNPTLDSAHAGTPYSYLKDPVTGTASIGILQALIY